MKACAYNLHVHRNLIGFLRVYLTVTSSTYAVAQEVERHKSSGTSEELTSCQAKLQLLPGTHCLFIHASDVEEDVKSGERVRKRFGKKI